MRVRKEFDRRTIRVMQVICEISLQRLRVVKTFLSKNVRDRSVIISRDNMTTSKLLLSRIDDFDGTSEITLTLIKELSLTDRNSLNLLRFR